MLIISQHLDTIVFEGDSLYQHIVREQYNNDFSTLLNHDDLPGKMCAFGDLYEQTLRPMLFGAVNEQPALSDAGAFTSRNAIQFVFQQSTMAIFTFGGSTIAAFMREDNF